MPIAKSILLFALAAVAEIGGAWLVWQAVREGKAWWWAGLGVIALAVYGFVATLQPDAHFGRILAAYGRLALWTRYSRAVIHTMKMSKAVSSIMDQGQATKIRWAW